MEINFEQCFNLKLKEALSERRQIRILEEKRKPSAVLLPFFYSGGQHHILFTKRTTLVRYHKGEISFPGGGYHKEDGELVKTALRETQEEIGLNSEYIDILGELDDSLTKGSQYVITPYVGVIPPDYKFKLNLYETAEIIKIPVLALLDQTCRKEEAEILEGKTIVTYFYSYQNHTIIGATARILKRFLDIYIQVMGSLKSKSC